MSAYLTAKVPPNPQQTSAWSISIRFDARDRVHQGLRLRVDAELALGVTGLVEGNFDLVGTAGLKELLTLLKADLIHEELTEFIRRSLRVSGHERD